MIFVHTSPFRGSALERRLGFGSEFEQFVLNRTTFDHDVSVTSRLPLAQTRSITPLSMRHRENVLVHPA